MLHVREAVWLREVTYGKLYNKIHLHVGHSWLIHVFHYNFIKQKKIRFSDLINYIFIQLLHLINTFNIYWWKGVHGKKSILGLHIITGVWVVYCQDRGWVSRKCPLTEVWILGLLLQDTYCNSQHKPLSKRLLSTGDRGNHRRSL